MSAQVIPFPGGVRAERSATADIGHVRIVICGIEFWLTAEDALALAGEIVCSASEAYVRQSERGGSDV